MPLRTLTSSDESAGTRLTIRADREPVASRQEYWRHVVGDTIVPMSVNLDHGPTDRDVIVTGMLGPVRVTESTGGAGELSRTAAHIRRSDPEWYNLVLQIDGHAAGRQRGRAGRLRPGDLSLVDLSQPFYCRHAADHKIAVTFPKSLLPFPAADVTRVAGMPIAGDGGQLPLVAGLLRQLPDHLDDVAPTTGARLGTAVVDLFAATVASRLDRDAALTPDARRRALLLRVHEYIERRLADPDLGPQEIADAHYISVRYLHRLFETQNTSVSRLIRMRRLECARRDLLEPDLLDRSCLATAARWGFPNDAHFSRAFRAAYGMPPGEYQRAYNGIARP